MRACPWIYHSSTQPRLHPCSDLHLILLGRYTHTAVNGLSDVQRQTLKKNKRQYSEFTPKQDDLFQVDSMAPWKDVPEGRNNTYSLNYWDTSV